MCVKTYDLVYIPDEPYMYVKANDLAEIPIKVCMFMHVRVSPPKKKKQIIYIPTILNSIFHQGVYM